MNTSAKSALNSLDADYLATHAAGIDPDSPAARQQLAVMHDVCGQMVQHGITRTVWYRATEGIPKGIPMPGYEACVAMIKARRKAGILMPTK